MASRTCWSCDQLTPMRPHGLAVYIPVVGQGESSIGRFFVTHLGDNCNAMSIATSIAGSQIYSVHTITSALPYLVEFGQAISWPPIKSHGVTSPHDPQQIAVAADVAHRCLSIAAKRVTLILARVVIVATAKDTGIEKRPPFIKIDALDVSGDIRPHINDGAHEVRHLSNDMAYGDFVKEIDSTDADLVLALMDDVLLEAFQSPAKLQAAQAARLARQEPATV